VEWWWIVGIDLDRYYGFNRCTCFDDGYEIWRMLTKLWSSRETRLKMRRCFLGDLKAYVCVEDRRVDMVKTERPWLVE
jgi:hypothetical protein